jgi:23S rRNA (cytidine1920-2'-O)/16S rRNA (cytidine1409-2'-O)-methyltransferase
LVRRKLVDSRAAARRAISEGVVRVGGIAEPKPSTLVGPADPVHVDDSVRRYVGRGGFKLEGALDQFGIEVAGRSAVDVGASTGGFTDCLLQRGAAAVTAIDVGYGQLDWRLRNDPRVTVVERTNIRHADPAHLGAPFDVVVADLSFISLRIVAGELAALGSTSSDWILLVKPQFEVGRAQVGRGGIVSDPESHREAIARVVTSFRGVGRTMAGITASPIRGAEGNREFLLWLRADGFEQGQDMIRTAVETP